MNKYKISIINAFAAGSTFLLIQYIYINIVYVKFNYMGFLLNKTEPNDYIINFCFLISVMLTSQFIPRLINSILSLFLVLYFFIIYIPGLSLLTIVINLPLEQIVLFYFTSTLCLIFITLFAKATTIKLIIPKLPPNIYIISFIIIMTLSIVIIISYYKFSFNSILTLSSISDLYDIRGDFREQNTQIPIIAIYALTISSKVFVPFLLFYGIQKNSKNIIIASFMIQLILFLITGQKSLFLGWILVYSFCMLIGKKRELETKKIVYIIILSFFSSIALYFAGIDALLNIIIRRIFLIPGVLTSYYLEYFSNNPLTLLSYSIASPFIDKIYDTPTPFIIGKYYFSRAEMSANVNYLVSSFSDLSYFGMVLYTIIICVFFKGIDMSVSFKDNPKLLSLLLLPIWALLDSSMPTVFLTHGLMFSSLMIVICPVNKIFK